MQSLVYLRGRRLWVVPDVLVWGLADEARFYYLGVEEVDSTSRVMLGSSGIGGSTQDILYSDLVDFRGNKLPSVIDSPKVLIRLRSSYTACLIGTESDNGFRVARDANAPEAVRVDFFIYEMGINQS